MSDPVGVEVVVVAVTPGESSACERAPCRLELTMVLGGEDLDIAGDDERLLCCERGVSGQPVVMPFRGGFLVAEVAASGFGRGCGARGRARERIPASWENWRGPLDPARKRAWPRARMTGSDETAASGTEFPLHGLGSGVLRRSIFRGSEGGRGRCFTGQCTSCSPTTLKFWVGGSQ